MIQLLGIQKWLAKIGLWFIYLIHRQKNVLILNISLYIIRNANGIVYAYVGSIRRGLKLRFTPDACELRCVPMYGERLHTACVTCVCTSVYPYISMCTCTQHNADVSVVHKLLQKNRGS